MRVGAMTSLTEIEENSVIGEAYPGFSEAVQSISTPLLRNMGSIGGNLLLDTRCNYYDQTEEWREGINFCMKCEGEICWVAPSSPRCWAVQSSDSVPILMAMGAEVLLRSADGERRIPLVDLYQDDGIQFTTKQPGELLTEVLLPAQNGWQSSYLKLRRRDTFDFPVLGVGVFLRMDGETISELRIRIGGIGSIAHAASATEEALIGSMPDKESIRAAAQASFKPTRAMDNTDHGAAWRKKMAPIFVARAIEAALARNS
ncbi:MAG: FAD binding domain-containing protein, partial [Planctomycetota bacterium]|jgi:4-hydroxybenzoyl-CoA reductase subunit beta